MGNGCETSVCRATPEPESANGPWDATALTMSTTSTGSSHAYTYQHAHRENWNPLRIFRQKVRFVIAALRFKLDPCRKRSYELDRFVADGAVELLDQDVPRTAGLLGPHVAAHLGRIRALLLRLLAEDPELGYCQGLHLVAAVFTAATGNQVDAYSRFHAFVQRVRGLWLPGFPLLQVGSTQFAYAVRERPWYRHFHDHCVEPSMFLPQALLTMFTLWLPLATIVQCLAIFERLGLSAMVATTVAVLEHSSERILKAQRFEGILGVLQALPDNPPSPEVLVSLATNALPAVLGAAGEPPLMPAELQLRPPQQPELTGTTKVLEPLIEPAAEPAMIL